MNRMIQLKQTTPVFLVALLLCFGVLQGVQAVVPPPDGGYPGFNTAEGQNALISLTTGSANAAVGWFSLGSLTTGSFNTAVGAGTLLFNTADNNTALGAAALLFNTTGSANTATGVTALLNNSEGSGNTANGWGALSHNNGNPPDGSANTAVGAGALFSNTTGDSNTAIGLNALSSNTTGAGNTAVGVRALDHNTEGSLNIALGVNAGHDVVTAQNAICIGLNVFGADVGDSCFIGNIFGQTSASGAAVYVNSNHRLGTLTSSRRFKDDIKPMERVSEALFALKPVTFHYKKEIDPAAMQQFGLVAEEVEKVNPDLVVRDKEGKPYSVRYEAINAMLLNEFLKEHKAFVEEHRTVQEQGMTIARLQKQIEALTTGLQKVSAQLELNKSAPQTVVNNQ
jgi:Chaperone of endosialidase